MVRTRTYVTEIADHPAVGRAHGEAFRDAPPAATMVEVSALIAPDLVMDADAVVAARAGA